MKINKAQFFITLTILVMGLVGCGGGGGGGGGAPSDGLVIDTSGTVSPSVLPEAYSFSGTENHAYSARLEDVSGDTFLAINAQPDGSGSTLDMTYSFSSIDESSFIVPSSMMYYALVSTIESSSFNLQVYDNHLSVDGPTRTRVTKSQSIYFSFDAEAGQAYNIKVTPTIGDPTLRVYTGATNSLMFSYALVPDSSTLVGESTNTGAQEENIVFVASESKTHYVKVSNTDTSAETEFSVSVESSDAAADLQVSVDSLNYSGGDLTVNYTVSNSGVANSTGVNVHFWLDSATPPAAGSVSDDLVYIAGISPGGGSYSSSRTITVGALEYGTLYAYVDSEEALVEADETNNVSTGYPWSAPVLAPQTFDFEDSLKPTAITFSGEADWSVISGGAYSSSNYSFRSGTIVAEESSCFEIAAEGVDTVTFDWKALKDTTDDILRFYVNGYSYRTYSDANVWVSASYSPYSTALNTFKWCYTKGITDNTGVDDGAWVDNIEFQPERPDLSVSIDSVSSDGSSLTINYTVNNNTGAASAASTIDLWADLASAPVVGSAGDAQQSVPVIAGNGSHSGTATVASVLTTGTVYAIVDTADNLSENDETNNVSVGRDWVYLGTPIATYDFEDGVFPTDLTTPLDADAGWEIDAANASSGTQSIRASTITHSQTACTAVTVDASAIMFDWKVSSESCCDDLVFYMDGTLQDSISGTPNWASMELTGLTTGTPREFKWCYEKDGSVDTASDTGWVDNIRVY